MSDRVNRTAEGGEGVRGCGCGQERLGPLGTPRVVDGVEHRWGRPCRRIPAGARPPDDTTPPEADRG